MPDIKLRDLLEAGCHFGHRTQRWNPKMKPYIFGARNGIHIVDLQKTQRLLKDALNFLSRKVAEGETVLFVGTKPQAQLVVEEEARRARMPFVTNRWLGGTLTNFVTLRKSLERLNEIDALLAEGSVERLQKKEVVRLEKEQARMLKNLRGLRGLAGLRGARGVVDSTRERIAIRAAHRAGIPVVAVVDTNGDPDNIQYVVPANDDAIGWIRLTVGAFADACLEAAALRHRGGEDGTWEAPAVQEGPRPDVVFRGRGVPAAPAPEDVSNTDQ